MSKHVPSAEQPNLKRERALARRAAQGDRTAYLDLFMSHLPLLDRYVRREVRYAQQAGLVGEGLIDPRAIVDQVYIAGLHSLEAKPARRSFRSWLRYLALHIIRQQIRTERQEAPPGPALERTIEPDGHTDTEFWEYYQPDDIYAVEDILGDARTDPEQELERREMAAEIERQIDALPEELRELLRLRVLEGMHAAEIATLKDLSPLAVQESLREACRIVRQNLSA